MKIILKDFIGPNCLTMQDGEKLYKIIIDALRKQETVEIDFAEVRFYASPFFNMSLGRLLQDFSSGQLNSLLRISNLSVDGLQILKKVIENSSQYYGSEKIRKAQDDTMRDIVNNGDKL